MIVEVRHQFLDDNRQTRCVGLGQTAGFRKVSRGGRGVVNRSRPRQPQL